MKKKGLGSPADKLGVHIRKYRNQKKWSQKDLANKIGTDQKRISKIENTMKTFRRCSGQSKLCTTLTSVF